MQHRGHNQEDPYHRLERLMRTTFMAKCHAQDFLHKRKSRMTTKLIQARLLLKNWDLLIHWLYPQFWLMDMAPSVGGTMQKTQYIMLWLLKRSQKWHFILLCLVRQSQLINCFSINILIENMEVMPITGRENQNEIKTKIYDKKICDRY